MLNLLTPSYRNFIGISQVSGNWLPAYNPIPFKFTRIDGYISNIQQSNQGKTVLVIFGTDFATPDALGKYVYVNAGNYNGTYLVIGFGIVGTSTYVTIDTPFIGSATGGYANNLARTNYRISVSLEVYRNSQTPITRSVNRGVDQQGNAIVDVAPLIRDTMLSQADAFSSAVNYKSSYLFGFFEISFRELWDGSNEPQREVSSRYYFTYSSLQLGNTFGANMYQYTPLIGKESVSSTKPDLSNEAKFLTRFTRPKYVNGWPFTLSFIYSEYLNGQDMQRVETRRNVNGSSVSVLLTDLTTAGEESLNYLNLSGNYAANVDSVDVYLQIDETLDTVPTVSPGPQQPVKPYVGSAGTVLINSVPYGKRITRPYASPNYITNYYTNKTYISNNLRVTEILPVDVVKCVDQPFYLMWLNTLGGMDYYMFSGTQVYGISTRNNEQFEPYNAYIANTERNVFELDNEASETYTLGSERVTSADLNGLTDLLTSPVVYRVYEDGTKQRVLVVKGSFNVYETRLGVNRVELEVVQPEKQIQLG